jgi:hypothetical protein
MLGWTFFSSDHNFRFDIQKASDFGPGPLAAYFRVGVEACVYPGLGSSRLLRFFFQISIVVRSIISIPSQRKKKTRSSGGSYATFSMHAKTSQTGSYQASCSTSLRKGLFVHS